ncbi:MAG: tyrosine-type recombinase/integrase [Methanobrevibacter sp.]|nr:tyrosine-type recombinase/integrase [Methanobrevibacter sp.]MBR1748909.1 tyrosine-type recombinase/integrase [Bacilli bacterium]
MYKVTEDIFYNNFISSKHNITDKSKYNYEKILTKFATSANTTLEKIISDCKTQQDRVIEKIIQHGTDENGNQIIEKQLIQFDVNSPDSKIKLYLDNYVTYCKNKGNSNTTINQNLTLINTFLKYYNITLPNRDSLKKDAKKWYLLTKEDFKYILNDSPLIHASLIKFLMSSGMRISDALNLTIGDFMKATQEYHNCVDVNDFIDNAPADMIGTWYFHPQKTRKFQIPCLTFNDPESSNFILQHLRKIKNEYIPYAKKKYGVEKVISKTDALFGSQKSMYVEPLNPNPTASQFWQKNKKLREWRILKIKEAISKGELSEEDFDKEVAKIPKFHAHACRKFFETTIAKNCGDLRICTLMEGHVSPVSTDSSYIKQDIENVRETYMSAIDDFSLEKTEVKVYTSEVRKQMEDRINNLEVENQKLKSKLDKIDKLEEVIENMGSWLGDFEK